MRALELQEAIYARLTGFAALTAIATGGIHDHVPQDVAFDEDDDDDELPDAYVVVGDDTATPADTDTTVNTDHVATVHTWSRYRGFKETKQMQQAIYDALHRNPLTVSGAVYIDCSVVFQENFLEPDGLTRHGVQRFMFLIDEVDS
jgi:hypothetical protein